MMISFGKLARSLAVAGVALAGFSLATTGASHAWQTQKRINKNHGKAVGCYRKVRTADVYKWVKRKVLVQPAQKHVEVVPAAYKLRTRKVQVRKKRVSYQVTPAEYAYRDYRVKVSSARKIKHHTPAVHRTVHKKVMVSAAHTAWVVKKDKWGKRIHCQVEYPATYKTVAQTQVVRPASISYRKIPATYKVVQKKVLVRKARKHKIVHPAQYKRVEERVLVRKAKRKVHKSRAVYKWVKEKVLVSHGKVVWQRVSAAEGGC